MEAKDWDVFLETYKDLKDKYLHLKDLARHMCTQLQDDPTYEEEFKRIVEDKHG